MCLALQQHQQHLTVRQCAAVAAAAAQQLVDTHTQPLSAALPGDALQLQRGVLLVWSGGRRQQRQGGGRRFWRQARFTAV